MSVQPTFCVPDPAPSLGGELQLDTKVPPSLLRGSLGSRAPCHTGQPWPTLLSLRFLRAQDLKVSWRWNSRASQGPFLSLCLCDHVWLSRFPDHGRALQSTLCSIHSPFIVHFSLCRFCFLHVNMVYVWWGVYMCGSTHVRVVHVHLCLVYVAARS